VFGGTPSSAREALQKHLMASDVYEVRPRSTTDGINDVQLIELKSKKKTTAGFSEVDRWFDIWRILFPGMPLPPHPCKKSISFVAAEADVCRVLRYLATKNTTTRRGV